MKLETGTDRLLAEIEGPVGWLIYNNPERHNALSLSMQQAVPGVVQRFEEDPEIRLMVLRGAGDRAFVSGADISEFEELRSSVEGRERYDQAGRRAGRALASFSKPLVAMIRGYCLGGGLATALHADIRIAAEGSRFGIPAARLGLGYGFAGIRTLVQLVGPAYANEILLSARRFSAEEALGMGLVNRVVSVATLEATVQELAEQIAANAPMTMNAAKFAIRQSLLDPERRDLEECARRVEACFLSEDYREGRRAFTEKRRPVFRGQ